MEKRMKEILAERGKDYILDDDDVNDLAKLIGIYIVLDRSKYYEDDAEKSKTLAGIVGSAYKLSCLRGMTVER
jgi:hypothetical protein